jgi:hypothetical protein
MSIDVSNKRNKLLVQTQNIWCLAPVVNVVVNGHVGHLHDV